MARSFQSIPAFMAYLARLEPAVVAARHTGMEKAAEMLTEAAKNLVGQETPEWPELAAATIMEKERLGYTGRVSATDPNLRRGVFRNSISAEVRQSTSVVLGSDDPIAPWLEHGTSRMPPRPTITLTMHQKGGDAAHTVAAHVMGAVAGRAGPMRSLAHDPAAEG